MMDESQRQKLLQQLLEKKKRGKITPADRYEIPPQEMPAQDAIKRRSNVNEVATGYTETQARLEAMRCLQCKNAPCIEGCPVQIKIQDFIAAIADGDYKKGLAIIKENSLLPAVCGRVCPQEVQCQEKCTVGKKFKDVGKAVSIGRLERFVADLDQDSESVPEVAPPTSMKVAVIGSGPGGIVAATMSPYSRPFTNPVVLWFTEFRSSGCQKPSCRRKSTSLPKWASISSVTSS